MKFSLKAAGAALALVSSQAFAINIGGVIWDTDDLFDFTTTDSMVETISGGVGSEIQGYARITTLNGTDAATFCPGCELTYVFDGYILEDTTGGFTFSGGSIRVYVDDTPDYSSTSALSAQDGVLFLELAGHTHVDQGTGSVGTLFSDPTPASTGVSGDGRGFLDVVGGLAASNFDTNTFALFDDVLGTIGFADFQFTSSFQLLPGAATFVSDDGVTYGLFGSNDLQGNSIPEPASIALLGLGLAGLGFGRRKMARS